jgi:hypothetical protein
MLKVVKVLDALQNLLVRIKGAHFFKDAKVEVKRANGAWFKATITEVRVGGTFDLRGDDGVVDLNVNESNLRNC